MELTLINILVAIPITILIVEKYFVLFALIFSSYDGYYETKVEFLKDFVIPFYALGRIICNAYSNLKG